MTRATAAAPATARRSQEERRRQTQTSVLEACIDVLVDRGFNGLTTTEVAARAGVSRGAQAHYFRTREDLIIAATEYLMDTGTRRSIEAAERARGAGDALDRFIDDAERFFFDRIYIAMLELLIAARTNPGFRRDYVPIVARWRARINRIWLEVFEKAGIPRDAAERLLHLTNFLLRGMALTALWDDDRATRDATLKTWRATIEEMAAAARGRPPPTFA